MRRDTRLSYATLRGPGANKEIAVWTPFQNQGAAAWSNRGPLHWMQPAPGRLAHIGWACACLSGRVAPKWTHPQIRPSNESWTADEPRHRSGPGACRIASALL